RASAGGRGRRRRTRPARSAAGRRSPGSPGARAPASTLLSAPGTWSTIRTDMVRLPPSLRGRTAMPSRRHGTAGPLGAALLVMVLVGCTSKAYRVPVPPPEPAPSVTGPTAQLTEMLSEIATAFGTQEPHGTD